jgi:hypothetical protein
MAIIEIPVGEPYGTIPVNTLTIYSAVPHPPAPDTSSDLLIDSSGARSIQALAPIKDIGLMLGTDFAEFTMASVARSTCFVNRTTWVSIVPHPQIAGVVQINFANHYIPVRGTVTEVRQALQSAVKFASAGADKPLAAGKRRSRTTGRRARMKPVQG